MKEKRTPVVIAIVSICILFAVLTTINTKMFELFEYNSQPRYIWQYLSGAFMHGSSIAPKWFIWVHLGMNLLMIIPFGVAAERRIGSRKMFWLFLSTWLITSSIFKLCFWDSEQTSTGVSLIGYSFAVVGGYYIVKERSQLKKISIELYSILVLSMIIMLCPVITGWFSSCMHCSGACVGIVFLIVDKYMNKKK